MEAVDKFEGKDTFEPDITTYEKMLIQMFDDDKNIKLKTRIQNIIEFSRFHFIADLIELQDNEIDKTRGINSYLKEEADLLRNLGHYIMLFAISDKGLGRNEFFESLKAYNLGKLRESLGIDEVDDVKQFKRILKKMK